MIAEVRALHPQVFLAEAFTTPAMMARLGKVGYTQSYTYFTWRNTKAELAAYFTELNESPLRECFRPNFFVNTPDISPASCMTQGATARSGRHWQPWARSVGACTAALNFVSRRRWRGKEYLDSEKYQIRPRDFSAPGNIVAEIAQLNRIRRQNPALHSHLGFTLYNAWNDNILYFGKRSADGSNFVLVAISLDPHNARRLISNCTLVGEMGLADDAWTSVT